MSSSGELIYRPVENQDGRHIKAAQNKLKTIETFTPQKMPHLTLLGKSATKGYASHSLDSLLYPLPPHADETIELPIESFKVYRYHKSVSYYMLMLGDAKNAYHDEHHHFSAKSRRRLGSIVFHVAPHVTLGTVDPSFALDVDEDEMLAQLPRSLQFGPIETTHTSLAPRTVKSLVQPSPAPKEHVSTPYPPVLTLRPNSIPPLFLQSLSGDTMG